MSDTEMDAMDTLTENRSANEYLPDYVSPPGETLLETLEELGMSQAELARRIGRPRKTVNEIVQGKAAITAETAIQLERVLGIPAKFWLTREAQYREALGRLDEHKRLVSWVDWLRELPLAQMRKRDILPPGRDKAALVLAALRFFGVASPDAWREIWAAEVVSFRTSRAVEEKRLGGVATWLRLGELEALRIDCEAFDAPRFRAALTQFRGLTAQTPDEFMPTVRDVCARAGVAVALIQEIPGVSVYGATRWLTDKKALLQISLHHKSNDQFWFTFFHEAAHILKGGRREVFLLNGERNSPEEHDAHSFAAEMLIPFDQWHSFITSGEYVFPEDIEDFAARVGIAPGVVVGRLQHEQRIAYTQCQDLKVRYRWESLPEVASEA